MTEEFIKVTSGKVLRAHRFGNGSISFDMEINGVKIYGCGVAYGKNGPFIQFPSKKSSDGKYYSHAYCKLDEDWSKKIINKVHELLE